MINRESICRNLINPCLGDVVIACLLADAITISNTKVTVLMTQICNACPSTNLHVYILIYLLNYRLLKLNLNY